MHLLIHAMRQEFINYKLIINQVIAFFRFIPMKTTNRDFGEKLKNGSYTGVIGMVARNEAQAIMRSGYFISCMDVLDYTMVLWKSQ